MDTCGGRATVGAIRLENRQAFDRSEIKTDRVSHRHVKALLEQTPPGRARAEGRAFALADMNFSDDDGLRKVFDLSSPMQMLAKLQWENDQIKSMLAVEDPKVIFAAFNAAATAWHLIEWVKTFARVYSR